MRAVKGEVVSSNPISLAKAAAVLSRFATSKTGARPDTTAYLKLATSTFNELVAAHCEIRAHCRIFHIEEKEGIAQDEDDNSLMNKKKIKKRKHSDSKQAEVSSEKDQKEGKCKKKKKTFE